MLIGVTGAGGVLGERLCAALELAGHDVVRFVGDVRDLDAVSRWAEPLDTVLHAAALVPVSQVEERKYDAVAVNVGGTANVVEAIARLTRCSLVYISTSHVYSPSPDPLCPKVTPVEPNTFYGLTKWQGEQIVRRHAPRHLIIRIFSFFDPLQQPPFLVPSLTERVLAAPKGGVLDLKNGGSVRDIADAEWVAGVCAQLISRKESGLVNCGLGRGVTVRKIAEGLARALGRPDIQWRNDDIAPTRLVADVRELKSRIGELPPFDLAVAFKTYAARRARQSESG